MNTNYYAILMAGGIGSRFWPVSTPETPKQFHDMLGCGQSLLQKTFSRLQQIIPAENILVLTNQAYEKLVLEQLPAIKADQILLEPEMRNTAPCILYASLKIQSKNPDAITIVAPSDHWIENETLFAEHIQASFDLCEKEDALVTLGIQPTFPNTGYGYIEFNKNEKNTFKKVTQFREKPDYQTAKSFLQQGNFLWNAGIFVWSIASITKAFANFQPEMNALFQQAKNSWNTPEEATFIAENYGKASNISIDYAIMEPSNNVYVLPATFDWSDLGTWGSLHEKLEKDTNQNAYQNITLKCDNFTGNIIHTQHIHTVVAKDLHNFIIVEHNQNLLILPKESEQELKKLLQ